MMSEGLSAWK